MPTGAGFSPPLPLTVVTAALLALLLFLGFWQLQRAQEKAQILSLQRERGAMPPLPLAELAVTAAAEPAFRQAVVSGRFLPQRYCLLDNRTRQGRFGYEVLSVMQAHTPGEPLAVIVNRGWVPGDPARRSLPEVPPVRGQIEIQGRVHVPAGDAFLLEKQSLAPGWPKVIQAVQVDLLQPALAPHIEGDLFPYTLRLQSGEPGALATGWEAVNVQPSRHLGYAVQWFAMAAVLAGYYLYRGFSTAAARRAAATESPYE